MARDYTVVFEKVSVSAVQDLFQIIGAAGKIVQLVGFNLDDVDATAPTNTQLAIRVSYLPATVTNGSGGSAPTPQKVDPGDAAASFTAKANSTTQATTNGTKVTLWEGGFNVFQGRELYLPAKPPIGPSESVVIELITTPTNTLTISGTAYCREIGG